MLVFISRLEFWAVCGIRLYRLSIIAFSFTVLQTSGWRGCVVHFEDIFYHIFLMAWIIIIITLIQEDNRFWHGCQSNIWSSITKVEMPLTVVHAWIIYSMYRADEQFRSVRAFIYEPRHDKTNKMSVRPAKTQISLGIRPVWSESPLSARRKLGFLATHWAYSEDSDQTGWMPRLICVFAGRTAILLGLSCRGSYVSPLCSCTMP